MKPKGHLFPFHPAVSNDTHASLPWTGLHKAAAEKDLQHSFEQQYHRVIVPLDFG